MSAALVGTTDPRHLRGNLEAVERGPLPEATRNRLRDAWRAVGGGWAGLI